MEGRQLDEQGHDAEVVGEEQRASRRVTGRVETLRDGRGGADVRARGEGAREWIGW